MNPFDQFDAVEPTAPPSAVVGGNPFDQFDAPTLPPGKKTGYGANLAAAVVEGAAGVGNVLSDPFGNLVGKPLATGIQFAHDALAPVFGYERFPADIRNKLLGDDVPQPVTRLADAAGRAIGAPALEDVVPGSAGEKVVRDYVPAAIGMAALGGGSGVTRNAIVNPLLGVAGQGAGQAAGSVVPEWAAPAAETAGNVAGMVGASAVGAGVNAAGRAVRDYVAPATGKAAPVLDATGAPIVGPDGLPVNRLLGGDLVATPNQQRLAGERLDRLATDPAAVRDALAAPPGDGIAKDVPTTAQLTRDPGLLTAERGVSRTVPGASAGFLTRAAVSNDARVREVGSIAEGADPAAVPIELKGQAATADAASAANVAETRSRAAGDVSAVAVAGEGRVSAAQAAAEKAAATREADAAGRLAPLGEATAQARERMGGDLAADSHAALGTALRTPVAEANQAAWGRIHDLAAKVDPDGTLGAIATPVRSAADTIVGGRGKYATKFSAPENEVLELARSMPDQLRFRDLKEFRTQLTDAIMTARQKGEPTGVFSDLIKSVDDAMNNAVMHQAEADAAKVASGAMRPEDAISARFREALNGDAANRANTERPAGVPGTSPAVGARPDGGEPSGVRGNGQRSDGGGVRPGDSAVAPETPAGRRAETLHDFVISHGGVQDPGGNFKANDLDRIHHRAGGRLINPKGMHPDKMREALVEDGFLSQEADINAFNDAMTSRTPVYRIGEAADMSIRDQQAREVRQTNEALFNSGMVIDDAASHLGVNLSRGESDHAVMLHMLGLDAEEAIRNAARSGEEAEFQRNADHNVVGDPGMPIAARQAEMAVTDPGPPLVPMDAEAAARYAAYRGAVRDRGARFEDAPGVGQILQPGRFSGDFKVPPESVPKIIVRADAEGAGVARAYLAAGGDQAALSEAAAFSLRQHPGVMRADGSLDPAKVESWAQRRGPFLSVIPETAAKIRDVVQAQRAFDTAQAAETAAAAAGQKADAARLKAATDEAKGTLDQVTKVAQGIVNDAEAAHAAGIRDRQASAVGRFLGDADPVTQVASILRSSTAVADMRMLAGKVAGNADATAGLQRAVADHILRDLKGNKSGVVGEETFLKGDQLQTFLRVREPALREVVTPEQMVSLRKVAASLERTDLSVSGSKLAGGSDSLQIASSGADAAPATFMQHLMAKAGAAVPATFAAAGAYVGAAVGGGPIGAALGGIIGGSGAVAVQAVQAARAAGLKTVDDLVANALLHPQLASVLLAKVTPANRSSLGAALVTQLRRASLVGATQDDDDRRHPSAPPENALLH